MAIRLAVVGPGRVGRALARRLGERGVDVLGFVGRNPASVAAALAFCGRGRPLGAADLATAHVVVFAVGDAELPAAVAATAAATQPRSCSLWLHTSGRFGVDVLQPLREHPVRCGALHPVAPFPDAESGLAALRGRPAVLRGEPRAMRLLHRLALLLDMVPCVDHGGDPVLYHAACALAANGLTALADLVDGVLRAHGGLPAADAQQVRQALLTAAVDACGALGPTAALSGPVVRGDVATVRAHLAALDAALPLAGAAYRALLLHAVELAERQGHAPAAMDLRMVLRQPAN